MPLSCHFLSTTSAISMTLFLHNLIAIPVESVQLGLFNESIILSDNHIETYRLEEFPPEKIALHMPCEESNMFATKCMCHIKCIHSNCKNAEKICKKYANRGCKYMLTRGGRNRIATLKRTPTESELRRFDISQYPKTQQELAKSKWKNLLNNQNIGRTGPDLAALVRKTGGKAQEALKQLFQLNDVTNKPLCLSGKKVAKESSPVTEKDWRQRFLSNSFAIVALNYHTPITLYDTMRSWNSSGFSAMARERLAILNDPLPSEMAIAVDHGFEILQPKDIPNAQTSKPNVLTIGAAFYYALQRVKSEFVLFLEKDFKMDESLSREDIQAQLITAAGLLDRGVGIVRLMSRKYQGCGTFKTCDHGGIDLLSSDPVDRKRNWYSFYCPGHPNTENSVDDCTTSPRFRCFTSWDSNWTLNAVMVKKSDILNKKYNIPNSTKQKSIAEIGLTHSQNQDGFESAMTFGIRWMNWRLPICISYDGLFIHEEIETSA